MYRVVLRDVLLRLPESLKCVSGVTSVFTSKMSDEDGLLLLSAAASAATIALAACSVKRRKRAKRFWMRPLFQRRHERGAFN